MLTTLPQEFASLWHIREDLFRVRIASKAWKEILLAGLDRPFIEGQIRQLVGKQVGPGVYEVTVQPLEVALPLNRANL